MKRSSLGFTATSTFVLGLGFHVFYLMPFVSAILTDVPPQPYRNWELLNQGVNYLFIASWAVSVPIFLVLISEWIYKNLGTGAR